MNYGTENNLTPHPDKDKSVQEIRQEFINKASLLLRDDLDTLTGIQEHDQIGPQAMHHTGSRKEFVRDLMQLVKAETEIQKLQVKNTADILKAIGAGQLSIRDAKEMVSLLAMISGEVGSNEDSNKLIIEIAQGGAK